MKLKELKSRLSRIRPFTNPKIDLEQYVTPFDIASYMIYTSQFSYGDIENKAVLDLCAGTGILGIASLFFKPKDLTFIECDEDAINVLTANLNIFDFRHQIYSEETMQKMLLNFTDKCNNQEESINNIDIQDVNQIKLESGDFIKKKYINDINLYFDNIDCKQENNENIKISILSTKYESIEKYLQNKNIKFDTIFMNPPFGTRNKHEDIKALDFALSLGDVVYSLHKRSTRNYILKKYAFSEVLAEIKYDLPKSYKFHKKENVSIEVDLFRFSGK